MLKKTTGLALALIMVLSVIGAFPAMAKSDTDIAYPVEGGNIYFDPTTGTITDCDDTVISAEIPEKISGIAVTSIRESAFYKCDALESVTIPSVTSISCC